MEKNTVVIIPEGRQEGKVEKAWFWTQEQGSNSGSTLGQIQSLYTSFFLKWV